MTAVRDSLLGAWNLLSFDFVRDDGEITHPYGPRPQGQLIYTPSGRMAVHIQRRGRLVAHSDDWTQATPAEIDTAFHGFIGYAGAFTVDEAAGCVYHDVELASWMNQEGTRQVRFYELSEAGDRLTLRAAPRHLAGAMTATCLVWERIG